MEPVVAESVRREAVERRRRDGSSERPCLSEPHVVEEDNEDVRRSLRGPHRARVARLRVLVGEAHLGPRRPLRPGEDERWAFVPLGSGRQAVLRDERSGCAGERRDEHREHLPGLLRSHTSPPSERSVAIGRCVRAKRGPGTTAAGSSNATWGAQRLVAGRMTASPHSSNTRMWEEYDPSSLVQ